MNHSAPELTWVNLAAMLGEVQLNREKHSSRRSWDRSLSAETDAQTAVCPVSSTLILEKGPDMSNIKRNFRRIGRPVRIRRGREAVSEDHRQVEASATPQIHKGEVAMATAKSTTPAQPGLGEAVEYRDARGNAKAALVIGTRKSLGIEDVPQEHKDILAKYGASLPSRRFSLDEGEVIVSVLSPSGKRYTRTVHFDADTKAWTSHTHND